ncbi:MAG: hypothetical protein CMO55_12675 [Verrucomicrobiales bacterium]|nr:hypothetical protein [Verrucomicrobiales bacterium]
MNIDSILLEEFRIERRDTSATADSANSDLRKWVAENLKKQFGGEDEEVMEMAANGGGCRERVAV